MAKSLKRWAEPIVRLTTMQDIEYQSAFDEFAGHMVRVAIDRRAAQEPRIVSFMKAALR